MISNISLNLASFPIIMGSLVGNMPFKWSVRKKQLKLRRVPLYYFLGRFHAIGLAMFANLMHIVFEVVQLYRHGVGLSDMTLTLILSCIIVISLTAQAHMILYYRNLCSFINTTIFYNRDARIGK